MRSRFTEFLLAAGFALAASAAQADDVSANLRLMAFGGDAQLTAVKHAIVRFNEKYPNVKVEVAIDPITSGWGDYVTHVLSQFNANNAYDVYGTAIETFRTFESRQSVHSARRFYRQNFRAIRISIRRYSNTHPIRARPISSRSGGTIS